MWLFKENLIKSNYFKLAKTAGIFHEARYKGITISAHFVKNNDCFFSALNSNRLNLALLKESCHQ